MYFYIDDCWNNAVLVQYLRFESTRLFGSKFEIFRPNNSARRIVYDPELGDVDFLLFEE